MHSVEHSVGKTPSEEGSSPVNIVPVPEPIEHSVDKRPSEGRSSLVDIVTVPDPIEHLDVRGGGGGVAPPSTGQRLEHSDDSGEWQNGRQSHTDDCDTPVGVGTGGQESSQEAGEAIVVGAVGSAAPLFLTGWADGVEVEFMIDTGCQVTILATSVFEQMCPSDPRVRSRLRPCSQLVLGRFFTIDCEGGAGDDCYFARPQL